MSQKLAEKKTIHNSEYEIEKFFHLSMDMLCIAGTDGYFKLLNPAWEKVLGYTIDELCSKPYIEFIHPEDIDSTIEAAADLAQGDIVVSFMNRYIAKNGDPINLLWSAVSEPEKGIVYAVAHDITKLKNNERELIESRANLEEKVKERTHQLEKMNKSLEEEKHKAEKANNAKSEFLSRMSHELRTPMNAILGFAQVLQSKEEFLNNSSVKSALDQILNGGWHLLSLIDEVLDLSKIEAGKVNLSMEEVSSNEVIKSCIDLLQNQANEKNIKLVYESEEECGLKVKADYMRFKQVLMNLLSNAIKYNRKNGKVIIYCLPQEDNRLKIFIQDTGYGIPNEKAGLLFEPFERLNAESSNIQGTGIGLHLSRKLAQMMNGDIGLESKRLVGSKFWLELEMVEGQKIPGITESERIAEKNIGNKMMDKNLLYIEDNPSNIMLIEQILERRKEVTLWTARTAEMGFETALSMMPQMILLDINLPGMDGFEFLERIRKSQSLKNIPVAILSANAMERDIKKGSKYNVAEYLVKPVRIDKFLALVDQILYNR
ncbi:MAG: ATP-binding protein [Spirochaetia bacterium]|nr:ATP-binding protein [Spirochaetia bacterium]